MAETDVRHISPEMRGRLQNGEVLGQGPLPRKERMPQRLLMAHRPLDLG